MSGVLETADVASPKFDFVFLHASPLLHEKTGAALAKLDFQMELEQVKKSLEETKRRLVIRSSVATVDTFSSMTTLGCRILHFAGHGHDVESALLLEKGTGGISHAVDGKKLVKLIAPGGTQNKTQLVFLSCCYSEPLGSALSPVVKHVVVVRKNVENKVAVGFAAQLYLGVFAGLTVQESFDRACGNVQSNYDNIAPDQFLLLSRAPNEPLTALPGEGVLVDETTPLPPHNIEEPRAEFFNRNSELCNIVMNFYARKNVVTVRGQAGVGKSQLALHAAVYLNARRLYNRTVLLKMTDWVPPSQRRGQGGQQQWSQNTVAASFPSRTPSPTTAATAATAASDRRDREYILRKFVGAVAAGINGTGTGAAGLSLPSSSHLQLRDGATFEELVAVLKAIGPVLFVLDGCEHFISPPPPIVAVASGGTGGVAATGTGSSVKLQTPTPFPFPPTSLTSFSSSSNSSGSGSGVGLQQQHVGCDATDSDATSPPMTSHIPSPVATTTNSATIITATTTAVPTNAWSKPFINSSSAFTSSNTTTSATANTTTAAASVNSRKSPLFMFIDDLLRHYKGLHFLLTSTCALTQEHRSLTNATERVVDVKKFSAEELASILIKMAGRLSRETIEFREQMQKRQHAGSSTYRNWVKFVSEYPSVVRLQGNPKALVAFLPCLTGDSFLGNTSQVAEAALSRVLVGPISRGEDEEEEEEEEKTEAKTKGSQRDSNFTPTAAGGAGAVSLPPPAPSTSLPMDAFTATAAPATHSPTAVLSMGYADALRSQQFQGQQIHSSSSSIPPPPSMPVTDRHNHHQLQYSYSNNPGNGNSYTGEDQHHQSVNDADATAASAIFERDALRQAKTTADAQIHDVSCLNLWAELTKNTIPPHNPHSSVPFTVLVAAMKTAMHAYISEYQHSHSHSHSHSHHQQQQQQKLPASATECRDLNPDELYLFCLGMGFLIDGVPRLNATSAVQNADNSGYRYANVRVTLQKFAQFVPWWTGLLNALCRLHREYYRYVTAITLQLPWSQTSVLFGFISKEEARARLMAVTPPTIGLFLVRFSSKPGSLAISFTQKLSIQDPDTGREVSSFVVSHTLVEVRENGVLHMVLKEDKYTGERETLKCGSYRDLIMNCKSFRVFYPSLIHKKYVHWS